MDSEVTDYEGIMCFASLHFLGTFCQLHLTEERLDMAGTIAPYILFALKRQLPGLANAVPFFQVAIETLSAKLRTTGKAYLNDLNTNGNSENRLVQILERLLKHPQSVA